jgi:maltooligosyltrehalose trehalohydrolase
VHLILENEHNEARWLTRDSRGHARAFDAQWNDDVHHVLHVAASGEAEGYYADYPRNDLTHLGRALAEGFAYQGEHMPYRKSARGEPSAHLPPSAFVAFIQNHDQIGNRAFGERLAHLVPPQALRAIAATYLLLPQVPMLFMGEEWAASSPFQFFCDFGAELADKVREGRRAEFARFKAFQDSAARERIPDPLSEASFQDSKLDWREVGEPEHAAWLAWYRRLLEVRMRHIVPLVAQIRRAGTWRALAPGSVQVRWSCEGREALALTLAVNLSGETVKGFECSDTDPLWQEGDMLGVGALQPWSVRCWLDTR